MAEEITWQEPPPKKNQGQRSPWPSRLAPLTKNPGKWSVWPCSSRQNASRLVDAIKKGAFTAMPPGQWEATYRTNDDGSVDLYVRYLGK